MAKSTDHALAVALTSGQPLIDGKLIREIMRPPWMAEAACRGMGTDKFFPGQYDHQGLNEAKAVCERCPVTEECLAFSERFSDSRNHGVWGGRPVSARVDLRRERGRAS